MARKPETTWDMLNEAMLHFQEHIRNKSDRCSLSVVDLLHVSNFKGGNASITEPAKTLSGKLEHFESVLRKIEKAYRGKTLATLTDKESDQLIMYCTDFLDLTKNPKSEIRGFGPSYSSALLAAHFIDLIPVLDRRALNGAGISAVKDSQGQVKNIARYYGDLIRAFRRELKSKPAMTLRALDKQWFSKAL
jgi:hypothetical protein